MRALRATSRHPTSAGFPSKMCAVLVAVVGCRLGCAIPPTTSSTSWIMASRGARASCRASLHVGQTGSSATSSSNALQLDPERTRERSASYISLRPYLVNSIDLQTSAIVLFWFDCILAVLCCSQPRGIFVWRVLAGIVLVTWRRFSL